MNYLLKGLSQTHRDVCYWFKKHHPQQSHSEIYQWHQYGNLSGTHDDIQSSRKNTSESLYQPAGSTVYHYLSIGYRRSHLLYT